MAGEAVDPKVPPVVQTPVDPPLEPVVVVANEGDPAALAAAPVVKPAPQRDHRNDRIDQLTKKVNELRNQNGDLTAKLAAKEPAATAAQLQEAEIERRAAERAVVLAAENDWNKRCNEAVEKGQKEFPDFDTQLANLQTLLDKTDEGSQKQFTSLIASALETGEAPTLIHKLGGDLNLAYKLMRMNPTQQAVEMTKLSFETKAALKAALGADSDADDAPDPNALTRVLPKPVIPIGNRAGQHTAISPSDPSRAKNLSSAEWHARRTAEVAEAQKARAATGVGRRLH